MDNLPVEGAQPVIRPVRMSLFPSMGSLQDVVDFAKSKLPITNENDLFSLLMTYHNTLLEANNGN